MVLRIVPLNSLMEKQVVNFNNVGIAAVYMNS